MMPERADPRPVRTQSPHEVTTSQRQADEDVIDALLATPRDELDALVAAPPPIIGPARKDLRTPQWVLDDLDHAGLEIELPADDARVE